MVPLVSDHIKLKMNLETKRLKLTEVTWDDVEDIHVLQSFPEVDKYNNIRVTKKSERNHGGNSTDD